MTNETRTQYLLTYLGELGRLNYDGYRCNSEIAAVTKELDALLVEDKADGISHLYVGKSEIEKPNLRFTRANPFVCGENVGVIIDDDLDKPVLYFDMTEGDGDE